MSGQIPESKISELADLIAGGRKIEAIKLYRELTGLGLKEAKDAIDALERSVPLRAEDRAHASLGTEKSSAAEMRLAPDKLALITECLFRENKIGAIKLYREATNAGLKEAKDQVEALEASLRATAPEKFVGLPVRKGCFSTAASLCLCSLVALYWFLHV